MPLASLQREPIGIFAENVEVGWTHASDVKALMQFQLTKHLLVVSSYDMAAKKWIVLSSDGSMLYETHHMFPNSLAFDRLSSK